MKIEAIDPTRETKQGCSGDNLTTVREVYHQGNITQGDGWRLLGMLYRKEFVLRQSFEEENMRGLKT